MAELMKGHRFKDQKHKLAYPAWAECKMDEVRCHVLVNLCGSKSTARFISFAGKPLANLEKFAAKFIELAASTGYLEFDCGFEANGTYNDSYRWVRSTRGLPKDLEGVPVKFFLFDLPESSAPFQQRLTELHTVLVHSIDQEFEELQRPMGVWVHDEEHVHRVFSAARDAGYEGLMVKDTAHVYQRGKRTYGWLKVKSEDDYDGVIEGFQEAVSEAGVPLGRVGSVHVRVEDGSRASPHGIAHELGRDMWDNPAKYVGQWCTFAAMERDRQGGYRHPVWRRLREAKA